MARLYREDLLVSVDFSDGGWDKRYVEWVLANGIRSHFYYGAKGKVRDFYDKRKPPEDPVKAWMGKAPPVLAVVGIVFAVLLAAAVTVGLLLPYIVIATALYAFYKFVICSFS